MIQPVKEVKQEYEGQERTEAKLEILAPRYASVKTLAIRASPYSVPKHPSSQTNSQDASSITLHYSQSFCASSNSPMSL